MLESNDTYAINYMYIWQWNIMYIVIRTYPLEDQGKLWCDWSIKRMYEPWKPTWQNVNTSMTLPPSIVSVLIFFVLTWKKFAHSSLKSYTHSLHECRALDGGSWCQMRIFRNTNVECPCQSFVAIGPVDLYELPISHVTIFLQPLSLSLRPLSPCRI